MKRIGLALILGAVLVAGRLHGQSITWLTDNRYVSVQGYAQTPPAAASNYVATLSPSGIFSDFLGTVSGEASVTAATTNAVGGIDGAYSESQAWQNSTITGSGVQFSGSVTEHTAGSISGLSQCCYADAQSLFQLSFSVTSPMAWSLTADFPSHSGNGNFSDTIDLVSATYGSVLGAPVSTGPLTYAGVLQPGDTYTLTFSLDANFSVPDPFGRAGILGMDVNFSVVPEPGIPALIIFGLASFYARTDSRKSLSV